jgi:hypothetical protein
VLILLAICVLALQAFTKGKGPKGQASDLLQ